MAANDRAGGQWKAAVGAEFARAFGAHEGPAHNTGRARGDHPLPAASARRALRAASRLLLEGLLRGAAARTRRLCQLLTLLPHDGLDARVLARQTARQLHLCRPRHFGIQVYTAAEIEMGS